MEVTEEALYPLDQEKIYFSRDELSLEGDSGMLTMRLGEWLNSDPVRIHKMIVREKTLHVDTIEVLNPLVSKLRRADPDYFKRFMGLNLHVDYPGYSAGVVARIPYENDPVGFYKWWRKGKHESKVHLSLAWQIKLFQKVAMMDPKMILKKDLELVR
ncbi:MAG: hypothetical protein IJU69_01680 [Bacteroidales bacterium]|nr:hypothetical protein [Bacteroidales bacterium]